MCQESVDVSDDTNISKQTVHKFVALFSVLMVISVTKTYNYLKLIISSLAIKTSYNIHCLVDEGNIYCIERHDHKSVYNLKLKTHNRWA